MTPRRTLLAIMPLLLAGCLDDSATRDPVEAPNGEGATPQPFLYNGTSTITEAAVCPGGSGCLGARVGDFHHNFTDTFRPPADAGGGTIEVTWNATVPEVQTLYVFVFRGTYSQGHEVVAEATGRSPLVLPLDRGDVAGASPVGVGFETGEPVAAPIEQRIAWSAQLLRPATATQ